MLDHITGYCSKATLVCAALLGLSLIPHFDNRKLAHIPLQINDSHVTSGKIPEEFNKMLASPTFAPRFFGLLADRSSAYRTWLAATGQTIESLTVANATGNKQPPAQVALSDILYLFDLQLAVPRTFSAVDAKLAVDCLTTVAKEYNQAVLASWRRQARTERGADLQADAELSRLETEELSLLEQLAGLDAAESLSEPYLRFKSRDTSAQHTSYLIDSIARKFAQHALLAPRPDSALTQQQDHYLSLLTALKVSAVKKMVAARYLGLLQGPDGVAGFVKFIEPIPSFIISNDQLTAREDFGILTTGASWASENVINVFSFVSVITVLWLAKSMLRRSTASASPEDILYERTEARQLNSSTGETDSVWNFRSLAKFFWGGKAFTLLGALLGLAAASLFIRSETATYVANIPVQSISEEALRPGDVAGRIKSALRKPEVSGQIFDNLVKDKNASTSPALPSLTKDTFIRLQSGYEGEAKVPFTVLTSDPLGQFVLQVRTTSVISAAAAPQLVEAVNSALDHYAVILEKGLMQDSETSDEKIYAGLLRQRLEIESKSEVKRFAIQAALTDRLDSLGKASARSRGYTYNPANDEIPGLLGAMVSSRKFSSEEIETLQAKYIALHVKEKIDLLKTQGTLQAAEDRFKHSYEATLMNPKEHALNLHFTLDEKTLQVASPAASFSTPEPSNQPFAGNLLAFGFTVGAFLGLCIYTLFIALRDGRRARLQSA